MTTLQDRPVTLEPLVDLPPEAGDIPRRIGRKTADEYLSYWGSLISAGVLTWLFYYRLMPFSGFGGFVVCWYVVFLGLYALVSLEGNPRPVVVDRFFSAVMGGAAWLVFGVLAYVVIYVIKEGWPALDHLNFFYKTMGGVRPTADFDQGGIWHAIYGSIIEVGIASLLALPLGIGTAVYMSEVGGKFAVVVRTVVESMTALPDILAGLFIYDLLEIQFGVGKSGICAALALTIMMTPIIARSADVTLRLVPGGLKEASLALGASQWKTVWSIVLPTARSGLATALILGIARAIGETAPVLITSGANTYFQGSPFGQPMNSLPLFIFNSNESGEQNAVTRAFGAATVLLLIVVILFAAARFVARDRKGSR